MSPTRKPKPPDKGAPPEHKPSRKVALEEVMRTLQDLVSNELATESAKPPPNAAETATAASKKPESTEKKTVPRSAYSADVLPTASPVASVLAIEPEPFTPDNTLPTQPPSAVPDELPDLAAEPLITETAPSAATGSAIPVEGLQQELPYLEDIPAAASAYPPAPTPEATEFQMAGLPLVESPRAELPLVEVKTDIIADSDSLPPAPTTAPTPTPAEAVNWDDIPVLEEAVELSEESAADAANHGTDRLQDTTLPPAETARRLAIQVAARLNVELRKSGQNGLSSDIITRLARLLQEALAKGSPNMENTTIKDDGSARNAGAVFRPPSDKH